MSSTSGFSTVRTEGGLLPHDVLERIAAGDRKLDGLAPVAYGLAPSERLNEQTNRSWNRLVGLWTAFQDATRGLPDDDPAIGLTRDRWLLPLFDELGYGRMQAAHGTDVDGKHYPISHLWGPAPIHLIGWNLDLDRRTPGVAGAARISPHGLVQEFLNRSDDHLWGVVSNGRTLRLLRDNAAISRQAYVEWDLEALFDGEVYADFALLWLCLHPSRVEPEEPEDDSRADPTTCWLERWHETAHEHGTRALEDLRTGVERAIGALGASFLAAPQNEPLRAGLRAGELTTQDYYRQLLRLVYRLLVLFVAEDRNLLFDDTAKPDALIRFERFYSTDRLRRLAERRRGDAHTDLYETLKIVFDGLTKPDGEPALALPSLGGWLFSQEATPDLTDATLTNEVLLDATRSLATLVDNNVRRRVDYRNLDAEELGSVYESLLELHPEIDTTAATFTLGTAGGSERKTTGSYYTPTSLIVELLDTALDPVLDEAEKADDPEQAILDLKVCDPAAGSGHFLVAAARRIATRLARIRTGETDPSPEPYRTALREIVGRCLYAADINPMAAELCKVALWMEALEPGKPLTFLDHHIAIGNSLIGTTPALIAHGLPDDAFKPLEGDDKQLAKDWKKHNRLARKGQTALDIGGNPTDEYTALADDAPALTAAPDTTPDAVRHKDDLWQDLRTSPEYRHAKLLADTWCAAYVWRLQDGAPPPPTHETLTRLAAKPDSLPDDTRHEVEDLADQYGFLHWHLAFPDVFTPLPDDAIDDDSTTGWTGGFDVVLGNPPWEQLQFSEKEFFARRAPDIAHAMTAAKRKTLIAALADEDPQLWTAYTHVLRMTEGERHLIVSAGRFPLCARGKINTFSIFAELMRTLTGPTGRTGTIVPSGIATDDTTKHFFQDLVEQQSLASLYDFENRQKLFPAVDSRMKFCLLTLTGTDHPTKEAEFVFFAHRTPDLDDPDRRFTLTPDEFALLNPNTRTCPIFRTKRDAELTKAIYRRVPVLIDETKDDEGNPWGVTFRQGLFNMASDSHLFRTSEELEADGWQLHGNTYRRRSERYVPLYEAKMVHHFDHRFGDYSMRDSSSSSTSLPKVTDAMHTDSHYASMPRYWVPAGEVKGRLEDRWSRNWLLGWRDICRSTDERTTIPAIIARLGAGDTFLLMLPDSRPRASVGLAAALSSFTLDFTARQKIGGTHLKYHVFRQLPIPTPQALEVDCCWFSNQSLQDWILQRTLELTYTAWDLQPFAEDLGYSGPPFRWDPERRFLLRCELDAAFFHLYGLARDDVDYVMDTFPIVRRHDERDHGEYRTKRVILEIYDALQKAIDTGTPYETILDPPAADPSCAHPPRSRS